jgi:hypothetical protein
MFGSYGKSETANNGWQSLVVTKKGQQLSTNNCGSGFQPETVGGQWRIPTATGNELL